MFSFLSSFLASSFLRIERERERERGKCAIFTRAKGGLGAPEERHADAAHVRPPNGADFCVCFEG